MSSQSIYIMLAGKTGQGKSATGNTIVGHKAFKSVPSFVSVTKTAQFEFGEFEGRKMKVVDGPGICDTNVNAKEGVKLVIDATCAAVTANPIGFHAILLILKYGERLTKEDVKAVATLKDILGPDFIRYHGILLITCGDVFMENNNVAFEDYCLTLSGIIKEWIDECSRRVILFDNRTTNENIKTEQMRKLLHMIDNLSGSGALYTSDIFDKAKQTRDDLLKKCKTPKLSEESLQECSLIRQQAERIDYDNPKEAVVLVEALRKRADALELDIIKQDRETDCLRVAITLAQQLKEFLSEKKNAANTILRLKQKIEEKELEQEMKQRSLDARKSSREDDWCQSEATKEAQQSEKQRRQKEEMKREEKTRKHLEDMEQQRKVLEEEKIKHEFEKQKIREEVERAKNELEENRWKEEEKNRKKEEEKNRKKEEEKNRKKEEEQRSQREREKHQEETELLIRELLEKEKLKIESMDKNYELLKKDQTWTWGDVGQFVLKSVTGYLWK